MFTSFKTGGVDLDWINEGFGAGNVTIKSVCEANPCSLSKLGKVETDCKMDETAKIQ